MAQLTAEVFLSPWVSLKPDLSPGDRKRGVLVTAGAKEDRACVGKDGLELPILLLPPSC